MAFCWIKKTQFLFKQSSISLKIISKVIMGRKRSTCVTKKVDPGKKRGKRCDNSETEIPLLDLGALEEGVIVCRPSCRNKSPYVADVRLLSDDSICVTHVPNLDSGGKCRPGARVLCKRQPGITSDSLGPHGTPKCELICQLLRVDEPENASFGGVWINAHPSIGEKLAKALLERGALNEHLGLGPTNSSNNVVSQKTMKRLVSTSVSNAYRPDFSIEHADGTIVLEVKQVVDSDYDPKTVEERAVSQAPHPVYAHACEETYQRAGIFPWGKANQKGPNGEKVVSARAIDHLRELTAISSRNENQSKKVPSTAVLFVCGRNDVKVFRPNGAACPTFATYLAEAISKGVKVIAHSVRWGEQADGQLGKCYDAGSVPLYPSLTPGDMFVHGEKKRGVKKIEKRRKEK
jgi:hypothetical protein